MRRDVVDDNGVGPDASAVADRHRTDHLRAGSQTHVPTEPGSVVVPTPQPDRDPREDHNAAPDLHEPADDHLTVRDVHARLDDDWVADAHLCLRHCEVMGEPGEYWNSERLHSRFTAVGHLRGERVAHPHQPQHLREQVDATLELETLTAVRARDLGIRGNRRDEPRLLRTYLCP